MPHEEEHLLVPLTGLLTAVCVILTIVFAKIRARFQGWLKFHRLFAGLAVVLMITHFVLVVLGE